MSSISFAERLSITSALGSSFLSPATSNSNLAVLVATTIATVAFDDNDNDDDDDDDDVGGDRRRPFRGGRHHMRHR